MRNKLLKLEALRGFTALYVVFHHSFFSREFIIFHINLSFLFKFGQEAVILFFLMSGFVIGYSYELTRDKSFKTYFQKRFYRIYIPFIIILVSNYLLYSYQEGKFINPQFIEGIGNLLMLQDNTTKPNIIIDTYLRNFPLWSLSYEWWFYMLFFPCYSYFKKRANVDMLVSVLVILSAITYIFYPFFLNRILMYFGIWWAGIVMSKSFLKHSYVKFFDVRLLLVTNSVVVAILMVNAYIHRSTITTIGMNPLLEITHFGFTVMAILAALAWQEMKWKYFDKILGVFTVIAPFSYALYISHCFLVVKASYIPFPLNKYILFFIYLSVAIAYSYMVEIILYPKLKAFFIRKR